MRLTAGRPISALFTAIVLFLRLPTLWAQSPADEPRVARLVRQLGAAESQTRASAESALADLGADSRAVLEQALVADDPEVRLRARILLDECRTTDLWSASQVELPAENRLASSMLASIVAQTGNHLVVGDQYGAFNEVAVRGSGRRMPFWQAVDELCRATENHLRPQYDVRAGGLIVCGGAPGRFPSAYNGRLRAQITGARRVFIQELDYAEPTSDITHTFQLNLQLAWEEQFRLLGYTTQPELIEARTDTGHALTAVQPASGSWNAVTPSTRHVTATLRLSPPPSGATRLSLLKLRWPLFAVGDRQVLVVPAIESGRSFAQEDVELSIESIERHPTGRYELVLVVSRDRATPEPAEILFQENDVDLFDADGLPLRLQNQTHQLCARGVQMRLQFAGDTATGEPELLRLAYPRLRTRRSMELVFRDVALPAAEPK
jgi:hypothetical protein